MTKTLLYVDDHPPARLLMQAIIAEFTPYALVLADSGQAALREAAAKAPDLYILDFDLPDMTGLALARALTALHPAPVILVSAYAEAIQPEQYGDLVREYLAKPLDPDHVAQIIDRALA